MANRVRTHMDVDALPDAKLTPKHLTKQEFARRLYKLMMARGWRQSELARRAGLPRDSISTYVRGKSLPSPQNLLALAKALDMKPEDILPNHMESALENEDNPAFSMVQSDTRPGKAWVRVNRLVNFSTATKIAELLENDPAD